MHCSLVTIDQDKAPLMTSNTEQFDGAQTANRYKGDCRFGTYSGKRSNAADVRARGAADQMWQKVAEDLEKIEQLEISEADDD